MIYPEMRSSLEPNGILTSDVAMLWFGTLTRVD